MLGSAATGLSWLGTFHSICAKILRKHATAANLNSNFTIIDTDDQTRLIKNICKSENIDIKQLAPRFILAIIDRWKNKGCYPSDVIINNKDVYEKTILPLYKIYQQKLTDLNSCDFGDLILHTVKILENYPDIRQIYTANFKYILVDEYQDTNFIQSKWLNLLSEKTRNLCCVGDDDQSIYSWRGAEIKNFLEFDQVYKNTKVIRLEQNYRSTQNILSVASNLIANNQNRVGKTLISNMEEGDLIKLNCFKNGKDEAVGISDEIEKNLKKKYSFNQMAILVRAIFQTRGSLKNAIVVKDDQILNEEGLRNDKEFVNHKILDCIGDLYTSGYRIIATIRCSQGGHFLTNQLLRKVFQNKENFSILEIKEKNLPHTLINKNILRSIA